VQSAIKRVIEPIFEKVFEPTSYGFRPNRSCKDTLREVDQLLKQGNSWVVDADIEDFFGSICHERMMKQIEKYISDGNLLKLLEAYLKQEVIDGLSKWTPLCGTPQGAVISPLLANLSLHELDVKMREGGYRIIRTPMILWSCVEVKPKRNKRWKRSRTGCRSMACATTKRGCMVRLAILLRRINWRVRM
jgi:RNA-directed DNA polymerase